MLKLLFKYCVVGAFNTLLHWLTFAIVYNYLHASQAMSNLAGFCIAVTFSFFVNAKWTFNAEHTTFRYFIYVGFMGCVALAFGFIADEMQFNPYITLVGFTITSLVIGFLYSNFVVFRAKA
ncbi:GtrA family protein [Rouxiella sp. WC2420]|uniref:Bactoprenol-linked glucose translocase n=1 Tax=Rouxiella sp. WC2420 TaxID=3234145 RepID=A0AB39VYE4_9GAMM